jgi:hypothetical protein
MKSSIPVAAVIETEPDSPVLSHVTDEPRMGTGEAGSLNTFDAYEQCVGRPVSASSHVLRVPAQLARRRMLLCAWIFIFLSRTPKTSSSSSPP